MILLYNISKLIYFSSSRTKYKFPGSYSIFLRISFTFKFIKDCDNIEEFVFMRLLSSQNKKLEVVIMFLISSSFKNPSSSISVKSNNSLILFIKELLRKIVKEQVKL